MAEPKQLLLAHDRYGLPLAFTRNGRTLATGGFDAVVRVWSVASGAELTAFPGHEQSVNCGCIASSGALVTGSTDATLRVWDLAAEEEVCRLEGHKKTIAGVAAHPTRPLVASASYDGTVRLWDLDEERETAVLKGHDKNVTTVRFVNDGMHLASGGIGDEALVWALDETVPLARLAGHGAAVVGMAHASDGGLWSVGHNRRITRWRPHDWSEGSHFVLGTDASPTGVAAHPTQDLLAVTQDHGVVLLDGDGAPVTAHALKPKGVYAPLWSPDGRTLAVGGADGKVRLYE